MLPKELTQAPEKCSTKAKRNEIEEEEKKANTFHIKQSKNKGQQRPTKEMLNRRHASTAHKMSKNDGEKIYENNGQQTTKWKNVRNHRNMLLCARFEMCGLTL